MIFKIAVWVKTICFCFWSCHLVNITVWFWTVSQRLLCGRPVPTTAVIRSYGKPHARNMFFFSMKNFTTLVLISRYLMHLWMHFWYCVRVQLHPYVCGHVGFPEAHVEKGIISSSGNPRWRRRNFTHGFMSGISILFHLLTCQSLDQSHTSLAVVVL